MGKEPSKRKYKMATEISRSKRTTIGKKLRTAASSRPRKVHVIPQKGSWAVKAQGAQRAYRVLSEKKAAISYAKCFAKSTLARNVIVHATDGTIVSTIKCDIPRRRPQKSSKEKRYAKKR